MGVPWDACARGACHWASWRCSPCAEGGHALLQDNLFGTNAFFDASGELVARVHFSDVVEFCYDQQTSYWEGDPVPCEPVCAYGGVSATAYPLGDDLPDGR